MLGRLSVSNKMQQRTSALLTIWSILKIEIKFNKKVRNNFPKIRLFIQTQTQVLLNFHSFELLQKNSVNSLDLQQQLKHNAEMEINNKMIDSIIRKYCPDKKSFMDQIDGKVNQTLDSSDHGLEKIAKHLDQLSGGRLDGLKKIMAPEKKLYVMIIGNHSAGKSSFINWFIGEKLQRTKVAIETVEINLVMHGSKKVELSGYNVMKMIPFMKDLYDKKTKKERFPGLLNNLSVKTSTSKMRGFEQIVFIDTPGLADGSLKYKFEVEKVYEWFAEHCDLVLVFFDPIGQALCQRTNQMIQRLYELGQTEIKFFMTKGDMVSSLEDQQKCLVQITQALSSHIQPTHGFEMPVIYIPEEAAQFGTRRTALPENNLPNLGDTLQKRLSVKVQNNLAQFKLDIQTLRKGVKFLKQDQEKLRQTPIHAILSGCQYAFYGLLALLVAVLIDIFTSDWIDNQIENFQSKGLVPFVVKTLLKVFAASNQVLDKMMIHQFQAYALMVCFVALPCLAYIIQFIIPQRFKLHSSQTMDQLARYEYQLQQLKHKYEPDFNALFEIKYEKLSQKMNDLAFKTRAEVEELAEDLQRDNEGFLRSETFRTFESGEQDLITPQNQGSLRRRSVNSDLRNQYDY